MMKFTITVKLLCVLAVTAILFNRIEANRCPSDCKYGTTNVLQSIQKYCTKLLVFRYRCTKVVSVCKCALPKTTTATTPTTTTTMATNSALKKTVTTKPTATRKTMLIKTSNMASIKAPSNSGVLSAICKNRPENEFYFPHPTDASKFVQCSVYGRAFLMSCTPLTVWNDDIKACARKRLL